MLSLTGTAISCLRHAFSAGTARDRLSIPCLWISQGGRFQLAYPMNHLLLLMGSLVGLLFRPRSGGMESKSSRNARLESNDLRSSTLRLR